MGDRGAPALSRRRLRRLRSRAQLLHPRGGGGVADTVRALAAVHAQLPQSAALTLRARTRGLDADQVESARVVDRCVVRAWTMRGTLHLVPAEDLCWLLPLYDPVQRARSTRRYRELRLTDDDLVAGVHVIRDVLTTHGPMVRSALAEHLARGGIDPSGQRLIHLINRAALEGVLCHGPLFQGDPSYVRCDDWLGADWAGRTLSRDAAVAELALRYVRAFGPVGVRDFAAWSGLPAADVRAGWGRIADRLVRVAPGRAAAWVVRGGTGPDRGAGPADDNCPADGPVVRLLPSFDSLLVGYRDRRLAVPLAHTRTVWTGGGWIRPTLVVDGRAVATWSSQRRRGLTEIVVHPFDTLDEPVRAGLADEAGDVGRFLGTGVRLTVDRLALTG